MQLGFSCFEAWLVRAKNSINVVMKNCLDFCLSILTFLLLGSTLMFVPFSDFFSVFPGNLITGDPTKILPLMLHAMFCATAVTIISGAVVERMSLKGYLIISVITAVIIYPLFGRLIWGDLFFERDDIALLAKLGFHDFAGGTLVHALGGAVALAAVIVIGPRIGRFGEDSQPIRPSSFPLASVGFFLLWVGWIGFNGGSQLMLTDQTPSILLVTILGGLSGMTSSAIYSKLKDVQLDVLPILNGGLAGLVSITAGADFLTMGQTMFVGAIGGLIPGFSQPILDKFEIDDGIGVVPTHLVSGFWGTFAVGLFMPLTHNDPHHEGLAHLSSRTELIAVQTLGSLFVVVVAFVLAYTLLKLVSSVTRLRVTKAGELIGLNVWEHRASTAQIDLLQQMSVQAELGLFNHRVVVEPYTQEHDIATFYNSVLDKFNTLQDDKEEALKEAMWLAEHDALTGVKNRRAITQILTQEQERIRRNNNAASVAVMDLDDFKKINDNYGHDVGDLALKHFVHIVGGSIRKTDVLGRVGGEEFVLFFPDTQLVSARDKLEVVRKKLASEPLVSNELQLTVTVSIGVAQMTQNDSFDVVIKRADQALYQAKKDGKNCTVCF